MMRNKEILKLMAGFRRFREKYFSGEEILYRKLATQGQNPKTLIIGCSDSRVDPALISSASPGEIFVIRNVANLVPPFESAQSGFHGVSAAIEFAVNNLKVENIIVLGHRQCGGISALIKESSLAEESFISRWMEIARPAKEKVLKLHQDKDFETLCRECEKESIVISLQNLKTFPFINDKLQGKSNSPPLHLFGIYFDLEQGELQEYDEEQQIFHRLILN